MNKKTYTPVMLAVAALLLPLSSALAQYVTPSTQLPPGAIPSGYPKPQVQTTAPSTPQPATTPMQTPATGTPATPTTTATPASPTAVPGTTGMPSSNISMPTVTPTAMQPTAVYPGPLPVTPTAGGPPVMFGSQMFSGRFGAVTFNGFNPDYTVSTGDRVLTRMWGAVTYEAVQIVDAQGNIFLPNVGPVRVTGVRNADLNAAVENAVKRVYRANVGTYATLDAAQPVKVYVTGFVRAPGLYGGLSSDSVLYYLDKAGGIDSERGSYMSVDVLRSGKLRAKMNLYNFLLRGQIDALQLADGDTIVVGPRRNTVQVTGEAFNPYVFEIDKPQVAVKDIEAMAIPTPGATHVAIVRNNGVEQRSEYYPLAKAADVMVEAGDQVVFTADKYPATIQVRISGAQLGERTLIMPYGAQLKDVIARLSPAPQANMAGLQLFRRSVAIKQKEALDTTLRGLEVSALTGRSSTVEEAGLRQTEAGMIMQFIERARMIQPKGQVVLTNPTDAASTLMEDGDLVNIPTASNTVSVSGEVVFPNTLVYSPSATVDDYIDRVGGPTQRADRSHIMVIKPNGVVLAENATPEAGDEIIVFPKVESKFVEIARGITSILYQLAVSAGVLANIGGTGR